MNKIQKAEIITAISMSLVIKCIIFLLIVYL